MTTWQSDTLDALATFLPGAHVEPYGSSLDEGSMDGWSDLDVVVSATSPFTIEDALGGHLWAFRSTPGPPAHVIRTVLVDGRRIDLTIRGAHGLLPEPASDNGIRFDAALAAAKLGRGSDLIGLHLCLGVLSEALVQRMEARDRATGECHHRRATEEDGDALAVLDVLREPLGPRTALAAYTTYASSRAMSDPGYSADARGLLAVIRRGELRGDGS